MLFSFHVFSQKYLKTRFGFRVRAAFKNQGSRSVGYISEYYLELGFTGFPHNFQNQIP